MYLAAAVGIAMFFAAVATNPKAPAPGECVTYSLYGQTQQKGDCN